MERVISLLKAIELRTAEGGGGEGNAYTKTESDNKFAGKGDVESLEGRVTAIEENGATLPDNIVTSESGEEIFDSVDKTVAEMYGNNITQLSQELGELDERVTAIEENGAGGGTDDIVIDEIQYLKYIKVGSNSQYVDTGITPKADYTYKAVVQLSSEAGAFFGCRKSSSLQYLKVGVDGSNIAATNIASGTRKTILIPASQIGKVTSFIIDKNKIRVEHEDGTLVYEDALIETANNGVTSDEPIYLYQINLGSRRADTSSGYFACIQQFVVFDADGNEIQHLRACIKDGVTGFYDEVTGAFFDINGSGELTVEALEPEPSNAAKLTKLYGPWASIDEAFEGIKSYFNITSDVEIVRIPIGLTFAVFDKDTKLMQEYWFNGGHTKEDIEVKHILDFADKVIDVTDNTPTHDELLDGKKEVVIDKDLEWAPVIVQNKNLLKLAPRLSNDTHGHTIEVKSSGVISIKGEHLGSASIFINDESSSNIPYWQKYAGKEIVLCAIGTIGRINFSFVENVDGVAKQTQTTYVDCSRTTINVSEPILITENIRYIRVSHALRGDLGDYNVWCGIYVKEGGLPIPVNEGETYNSNVIDTAYYNSVVKTYASTKEYIDKKAIGGLYVIPEKFGAKGDGTTDDSAAIARALEYAGTKKLPVKMYQTYLVSSPVHIKYDDMDVEMNTVISNSTSQPAVLLQGSRCNLIIKKITSPYKGFELRSETKGFTHNYIKIHTIEAKYGIHLNCQKLCWQNTFNFTYINGTGIDDGSIGILAAFEDSDLGSDLSEHNFYGGHIYHCRWGYKGPGRNNKFYSIHIEGCGSGFWFLNAPYAMIYGDRHAEQVFYYDYPYIKIGNGVPVKSNSANNASLYFYNVTGFPLNKIDLSDNHIEYDSDAGHSQITSANLGVIDAPIRCGVIKEANGAYTKIASKAYIYGKKLICVPTYKTRKTVTADVWDMRLNDNTTNCLPTTFVAGTATSVVYLHDSYIHFAFNDFKVIQSDDKKIKIVNSDGKLVWDGTDKPAGTYHFEIEYSDEDGYRVGYVNPKYDGEGELWYVNGEKLTLVDYEE